MVGLGGLELPTSPLSGVRSNQLSYRPGDICGTPQLVEQSSDVFRAATCIQITCEEARAFVCDRLFYSLKEVIQPHVPVRLPCYDFTLVIDHTVVNVLPKVRLITSGATNFHGVTGGVYKTRERIHRDILIRDY